MSDALDQTVTDEGGPLSLTLAREAFAGCTRRADAAAFLGAFAAEQRTRGMFWGLLVGAVGTIAVGVVLYARSGGAAK